MIISHSRKFIFCHIYKTGGTSVSHYFAKYSNSKNSYRSQFFTFLKRHPNIFSEDFHKHVSLPKLREQISDHIFSTYFKFCFVRNPWDWQVSIYHYDLGLNNLSNPNYLKAKSFSSFKEYIIWRVDNDVKLQYDMIFDNGIKLADYIGKLETLESDIYRICDIIGVPKRAIPFKNPSDRLDYREYYDQESKELIAQAFKKDIDTFGYEF